MYNILVPVDFSKSSFAAYYYASNFAQLFPKAKITMLHILRGDVGTDHTIGIDPWSELEHSTKSRLDFFCHEYPKQIDVELPKVDIVTAVKYGVPGISIAEYSEEGKFDIVIMGTRDRHGIFDKIIGSTSATAIRKSPCPVMIVHENVRFNTPKKVVFAFDEKSEIENAIDEYRELNSTLCAKTDFVHVAKEVNRDLSKQKSDIVGELFEANDPQFSFEIKTIQGDDIHTSLQDYCLFEKADVLALMHREEGIFGGLFKSQNSVKIAQEFHLPVLIFHQNKNK